MTALDTSSRLMEATGEFADAMEETLRVYQQERVAGENQSTEDQIAIRMLMGQVNALTALVRANNRILVEHFQGETATS